VTPSSRPIFPQSGFFAPPKFSFATVGWLLAREMGFFVTDRSVHPTRLTSRSWDFCPGSFLLSLRERRRVPRAAFDEERVMPRDLEKGDCGRPSVSYPQLPPLGLVAFPLRTPAAFRPRTVASVRKRLSAVGEAFLVFFFCLFLDAGDWCSAP